jgi:hypothetical protein
MYRCPLSGRCHGDIDLVLTSQELVGDSVECVASNIDEVHLPFHASRHSRRETSQFLANVFFEGCSPPPAHLLDLFFAPKRAGGNVGHRILVAGDVKRCDWADFLNVEAQGEDPD